MEVLNVTTGVLNALLFLVILTFMVFSCVRSHRLTRFEWISLSNLAYATGSVALGQITIRHIDSKQCNFSLHLIYSVEVLILFNLSMIIGYKVYRISHEIYEFSINGNLPSEKSKKCERIIIFTIWGLSLLYLCLFLFLQYYWHFANHSPRKLEIFNFSAQWMQVLLFIIVSICYFSSGRRLIKLQNECDSGSTEKPLQKSTRFVFTLLVTYVTLSCTLGWNSYT